ncbi:GspH/FimT family pseudopilin [Piscinibacter sp. HJYY11]|uniref:GspH/FimT family pseudopilin n=1 Tax=Piscinibacter sp. HJYY11 TaxID=2801333 RepID=UPI00191F92FB|nr:GspH/FimT family pseudopilin [Piscinibacter sp. HJYY11]MBL0730499.1 GspH/FimT family pseudopilin [Piscinibacter sp. HJYY11]
MHKGSAAARGFTLIETMATVAVAGIVMTAAVPSLHGYVDQQRLKGIAGELSSDLQHARSEALLRNEGVRVTFNGNACYVVHTGAADRCRCDANGIGRCDEGPAPLKTVALPAAQGIALHANVRSVLFAPEHGTASPMATLRLTGPQGRTLQHTVNLMGRVRSCAAHGAMAGYAAC